MSAYEKNKDKIKQSNYIYKIQNDYIHRYYNRACTSQCIMGFFDLEILRHIERRVIVL